MWPSDNKGLKTPVSGFWKNEHRFPYLKAAVRDLLDLTVTSTPSERVFSHTGELYSEIHANIGVRIFAINIRMRMDPDLGMI